MLASSITTYFISSFEDVSQASFFEYVSPFQVATDLIAAAFRVLRDGDIAGILEEDIFPERPRTAWSQRSVQSKPGFVMRFIRKFLLGLPLVGAASLVQLLLSAHLLAPVQWLARYRGSRRRRNSRDTAALIVLGLVLVGCIR